MRLANESRFTIGRITVQPATRQIICGDQREKVEPRVMQVLVALARAGGEVVSRDDLTEYCWEGRIVGEDSINRVLSRLRHIAAGIGSGSFQVETIRGVGYRLVDLGTSPDSWIPADPSFGAGSGRAPFSRRAFVTASAAAGAAAGVAVLAGTLLLPRSKHEPLPLAVQYYQRGLETRGQASLNLAEQGVALLREATRIDPQFAEAWGALAWSYRGLLEYGPRPDSARLHALSRSAAAHALELDPDNVDAQSALLLLTPFYGNWAAIEEGCRKLLDRHPRNSILEYNIGHTLCEVGRWRASVPYLRAVMQRERFWPLPHVRLVQSLYMSGGIEEADDLIEDGMKRFPRRKDYWLSKIRYLAITGRVPEALAFANDLSRRPADGTEPAVDFEILILHALADGSRAARDAAVKTLAATATNNLAYLPIAALSASVLGDVDSSFSMLEGFYFGRGPWAKGHRERPFTDFLFSASTAAMRRDPRFPALLRETGLENYWRTSGTVPDYRRDT